VTAAGEKDVPESPPPNRWMEGRALVVSLLIIAVFLILFFVVAPLRQAPEKLPTGQAPGTNAPAEVETPEEAKPPAQRESN
jgi:hypothetical protein